MYNADAMLEWGQGHADELAAPGLSPRPAKQVAVVTCMDARLQMFPMLNLQRGDAHIIRNAGGRVTPDVVRSLAASQAVLGTNEIILIMHEGCGLHGASDGDFLRQLHGTGVLPGWTLGGFEDLDRTVREGVAFLRTSRELPHRDHISGFVFDPETGALREVAPREPAPHDVQTDIAPAPIVGTAAAGSTRRQLEVFVALVDNGRVETAAQALSLSTAEVYDELARLMNAEGGELLSALGDDGRLVPTRLGHAVERHARKVLDRADPSA